MSIHSNRHWEFELVAKTLDLLQSSSIVIQSGDPSAWKTEGLDVEDTVRGEPSPPILALLA